MLDAINLEILTALREEAGLTQSDAARQCGLKHKTSRISVGRWESGAAKPHHSRRNQFIGYLWDDLMLREKPELFKNIWTMLVDTWEWEPLSDSECKSWGLPYISKNMELALAQQMSADRLKTLFEVINQVDGAGGIVVNIEIDIKLAQ